MIPKEMAGDRLKRSIRELMQDASLSEITVSDICSNCQLSNTSFYRYYHDKYDLLEQVYRSDIEPLIVKLETDEGYTWPDMLREALELISENAIFYQHAYQNRREQSSLAETSADVDIMCALRIIGHKDPDFHKDDKKMFVLKAYIKGYRQLEAELLASKDGFDIDMLVEYILACMPEVVREVLL